MQFPFFIVFALLAVSSSILVVSSKHLVHAILWLVVTFFATACLFVLLQAEFLAAIQLLVYAGAIVILYVFAIMLVNPKDAKTVPQFHRQKKLALWIGGFIFVELGFITLPRLNIFGEKGDLVLETAQWGGNTEVIGKFLFTDYILPFELVSIILLVAIIGAVVLAVRRSS